MSSKENQLRPRDEERDERNKARFVGPKGVESSELPNHGRPTGYNDTDVDLGNRNLPQQHGGEQLESDSDDFTGRSEGGVRGDPNISDADIHGGRGKN